MSYVLIHLAVVRSKPMLRGVFVSLIPIMSPFANRRGKRKAGHLHTR